jgi:hypothetical protein
MKKYLFGAGLLAVISAFTITSCNSGKEEKKEEKTNDTLSATTTAPAQWMMVRHKVANFSSWLVGFEAHDSMRLANGIHKYVVGRGIDDSNMVIIAMKIDDLEKAKAFSGSADLKEAMKKAGVISEPISDITDIVFEDTAAYAGADRMMFRHDVKDFDAWKKSFDSHKQTRLDNGMTDRVVATSVGNKNSVHVVVAIADLEKARAFSKSKDLQEKMKEAGVVGAPDVFFFRIIKKY